jgi:hypothetical protein
MPFCIMSKRKSIGLSTCGGQKNGRPTIAAMTRRTCCVRNTPTSLRPFKVRLRCGAGVPPAVPSLRWVAHAEN